VPAPEKAPEPEAKKDFFDVLFVGLFCFKKDDRVAVMPDGREPEDQSVQPHIPFLVVDPKDVVASSGWDDNPADLTEDGIYTFGKCTIAITKATAPGTLEAEKHHKNVFPLAAADPEYKFAEANAKIITAIPLGQGTLELFRRPGLAAGSKDATTVTRLRVRHEDDIFVTVKVEGEPEARVLALKPRTDIAIANSFIEFDPEKKGKPFQLFGRIAKDGHINVPEEFSIPKVPPLPGSYQIFRVITFPVGEGSGTGGSTGCCPP
jgi:hypothetical protein